MLASEIKARNKKINYLASFTIGLITPGRLGEIAW